VNETFTPQQMATLQSLANAMGGLTSKSAQENKLWTPNAGWVPEQKAVSSTPTALYGHGPGGLFSSMALERPVFAAMALPRRGLQTRLPVRASQTMNPLYGIYTGVTATSGSEANGVCDDPPVAGTSKLCEHSFVFSRRMRQTPVISLLEVGQVQNRGEHFDLQLFGNPFKDANESNLPTVPGGLNPSAVLNNEQAQKMFELGVAFVRDTAVEFYTGDPSANSAGGGNKYFYGLDILINTGYRDAITGQACPAADSMVQSFGGVEFTLAAGAPGIVKTLTSMYARLQTLAVQFGLAPATWALTMRPDMFYELVRVWPLQYNTLYNQGLLTGANNMLYVDGSQMANDRASMMGNFSELTGQYLIINNENVPVVLDDAIPYTNAAGQAFTSSIYVVPMTVLGGQPVTFMEYFDWNAPNAAMSFANAFGSQGFYNSSDSGRFLWHFKPPTNFCIQMLAVLQARLLLLTPQIAGRLTNVKYTPSFVERGWDTADTSFYANGGITGLNGWPAVPPSFYSPTS
jgi:hypothetical protein